MRRVHDRHMVLLQIRGVDDGQRQLTVHVVHVDDVRLELLEQRLELTLRFEGVDERGRLLRLLECGDLAHVVLLRDEVLAPVARLIVRMSHGEERDLVAERLQTFGEREEIRFGAALAVEVLVDEQDPHRFSSPRYMARVWSTTLSQLYSPVM